MYARGYPASPQEIAAAAAVHAEIESCLQALIPELGSRLGDQVAAGSSDTGIFLYAPSAGSADEAARVAREVLARLDVSAPVRTERWSPREEEWLDVTDVPSAMPLPGSRLSTNTFRSSGLLTWSEIWCDVDNSKRFRSSCTRHVSQGHRLKGVAALHNFLASIFTAPGVTTWRGMSGNTRKNQVTRLVTLRHQSTMLGALELERERSVTTGIPAWRMLVEVPSHRGAVALAGHLAAKGWRVRPRRRCLIVWADCEDDAKGLAGELSGDGRADADTAFRVGRVSYSRNVGLPGTDSPLLYGPG